MKPKFDISLILCFLISIGVSFLIGLCLGARGNKALVERKAVKEGRGVISEQGNFEWLVIDKED